MYLLVNVLEQTQHLTGIMEGFARIGIQGSTVIDSTGMGRVLMKTHTTSPLMKQINKVLKDLESSNKILLTVVREKAVLQQAVKVIRSFCGDLNEPGKGILFAIPLEFVEGLRETD
jgi:nitrogen regulatory protein PII